jgi:hypothetical protein
MAHTENPPFQRGTTWNDGRTIDSSNLGGPQLEGTEWEFEDIDYSSVGAKAQRTNRKVRCRIVRNASGIALLPKRVVRFKNTAGNDRVGQVDGYTTTTAADFAGVVDEWLPSAGVPANDLFYIVIEGPTRTLTDIAGDADNVFSVGDVVVALTAATSQATTAGRVGPQDLTGATALLANQVQNRIGTALSAKTTANTNADLLIDMFRRW